MHQLIVLDRRHHEQGEVHAAREVALEDGDAYVPAPHGQALALALFEIAPAHDGPARVAGEDPPARLYLVVEVGEANEACEPAPPVRSITVSRHLPGGGLVELGASRGRYGFGGLLAPFRPERISEPNQS
jgi:hypothetical protein